MGFSRTRLDTIRHNKKRVIVICILSIFCIEIDVIFCQVLVGLVLLDEERLCVSMFLGIAPAVLISLDKIWYELYIFVFAMQ